jgi:alginate O-acetyltransferase complex protein AlgI
MLFNSAAFLLFLGVVVALHATRLPWATRKVVLLVAGCVFYSAWNPVFLVLLAVSAVTDWVVAGRIAASDRVGTRRAWLALSLTTNLGLLAVFKYGNFLAATAEAVLAHAGIDASLPRVTLPLPVGISFYTFEALAYSVDVFRRRATPWRSFGDFGMFLTFFPHLVAGPIVRPSDFAPQLEEERRPDAALATWGVALLLWGLFQKVVLADGLLAPTVDAVFDPAARAGMRDAWLGALAFSGQIFFDFAGYTQCAIGAALVLGFRLPDNFDSPYAARGFRDFWRRWHISLSSWLRDYLYIPLGGDRHGTARTVASLAITMLLGGLWHGAAWTFVVWGGLHGAYLIAERGYAALVARRTPPSAAPRGAATLGALGTFAAVTVAWVFFRAHDFPTAFRLVGAMFGAAPADAAPQIQARWQLASAVVIPCALVLSHTRFRTRTLQDAIDRWPAPVRALATGAILALLLLFSNDNRAFIYFQF